MKYVRLFIRNLARAAGGVALLAVFFAPIVFAGMRYGNKGAIPVYLTECVLLVCALFAWLEGRDA